MNRPEPSNAKLQTVEACASAKCSTHCQSSSSSAHTRIAQSYDAENKIGACGCQATYFTSCVCSCLMAMHSYSSPKKSPRAQIQIDLSREQVASRCSLSGTWLQAAHFTSLSCPSSTLTIDALMGAAASASKSTVNTDVVASKEASARYFPSSLQSAFRIVRL